jgi:hypothetical protein
MGQAVAESFGFPVNIISPCLSILIHHLGDEQQAHWWPQFRDVVSSNDKNINVTYSNLT